jgi:hypothetical protein
MFLFLISFLTPTRKTCTCSGDLNQSTTLVSPVISITV